MQWVEIGLHAQEIGKKLLDIITSRERKLTNDVVVEIRLVHELVIDI